MSRRDWLARAGGGLACFLAGCRTKRVDTSAGPELCVMSFNIRYGAADDGENRWERRRDLLLKTIQSFDPDLLGLQEVLPVQADFLQQSLPGYAFHGAGREDGLEKGEACPVFYRRERFALLDCGHFWLSPTPDRPGSRGWDAAFPRLVSWVRLGDRGDDKASLVFANTHFDHLGQQARRESARLLARYGGDRWRGQTVILTGDFNVTEDDPAYRLLLRGGAGDDGADWFVDSYRAVHPVRTGNELTYHAWNGQTEGSRIDWILHSPGLVTVSADINRSSVGGRFPSDHYPVQAVLRYRGRH